MGKEAIYELALGKGGVVDYNRLASETVIERTVTALKERNIETFVVENRQEALRKLIELVPEGAEVMTGGSTTLEEIGYDKYLIAHPKKYQNWKNKIFSEKDAKKQAELRRLSTVSEYYIGSVHGIAETGEIVIASATGSQLGAYAYGARHIIWVAGTQKIVPSLETAIRRTIEHCYTLEDEHMKKLGYSGSQIGKMLILNKERPGRITMILVKKKLGF